MVFNHTSTNHAWFRKAISGDKRYQDYYFFRSGKTPGVPPTNWASKFGGSAWKYVLSLDKWYLHLFSTEQADLNWDNIEVREALKNVLRFWQRKGVVGFRFDVINLVSKPDSFQDDLGGGDGRRFYTDGPCIHRYLAELSHDCGLKDYLTVGEMSSTSLENCISYGKELSMAFSFLHLKVDYNDGDKWRAKPFRPKVLFDDLLDEWQKGMQEGDAWNTLFWSNHDQPTQEKEGELIPFCDAFKQHLVTLSQLSLYATQQTLTCSHSSPWRRQERHNHQCSPPGHRGKGSIPSG